VEGPTGGQRKTRLPLGVGLRGGSSAPRCHGFTSGFLLLYYIQHLHKDIPHNHCRKWVLQPEVVTGHPSNQLTVSLYTFQTIPGYHLPQFFTHGLHPGSLCQLLCGPVCYGLSHLDPVFIALGSWPRKCCDNHVSGLHLPLLPHGSFT